MIDTGIFGKAHLNELKTALTAYSRRHRVTSQNIANVETEGYKAQEYRFEDLLRKAQGGGIQGVTTHAAHMPIGGEQLGETVGEAVAMENGYDNGVNNVDVDNEMTGLATTELSYRLATRLLSMRYNTLREAVTGRVR
jgi:flagellar basal-body rod protein FlgB